MNTVYVDPAFGMPRLLEEVYGGQVVVRAQSPATGHFVQHARDAIAAAFVGLDPLTAQHRLDVDEFVDLFASLKASFIYDPVSLACIREILAEMGCDRDDTYIDVPRMRVATSHGYLTSGVAFENHPHRDTWYSAPMAQINWWLPVFEFASSAGIAFHPRYWSQPVRNGSAEFDYSRWSAEDRAESRQAIRSDAREHPRADEELELDPQVRVVLQPSDLMIFSGAQLHSTCANESGHSRWSIDFRTVSLEDVIAGRGAANVDSASNGSALRDFVRMRDFAPIPAEMARRFGSGSDDAVGMTFAAPVRS